MDEITPDARRRLIAANTVDLALVEWARHHHSLGRSPTTRAAVAGAANFGSREIEIRTIEYWNGERAEAIFRYAERLCLRLHCQSNIYEVNIIVGIAIHGAAGDEVLGMNSKLLGSCLTLPKTPEVVIRIEFNACFPAGDYQISLALVSGISGADRCYHWVSGAKRFRVQPRQTSDGDPGPEVTFRIE